MFNLVSLSACPVQIEIPELANIEPKDSNKFQLKQMTTSTLSYQKVYIACLTRKTLKS